MATGNWTKESVMDMATKKIDYYKQLKSDKDQKYVAEYRDKEAKSWFRKLFKLKPRDTVPHYSWSWDNYEEIYKLKQLFMLAESNETDTVAISDEEARLLYPIT